MPDKSMLQILNKFTRRELTEDEVYIFDLILCDNEIDRDKERFSLAALKSLEKLFIGKTGIFDHNPKSAGQNARIFKTELLTDNLKKTAVGESYTCLKACAYMVRTNENAALIKEIDAGIKKEVSISCSAGKQKCSVCGADRNTKTCPHVKGRKYGEKTAHVILDDITDAYEWSFVAVPAQVKAGVTKHYNENFSDSDSNDQALYQESLLQKLAADLKEDISRLCFLNGENIYSKAIFTAAEKMSIDELVDFKKLLMKEKKQTAVSQLAFNSKDKNSSFKLKGESNEC